MVKSSNATALYLISADSFTGYYLTPCSGTANKQCKRPLEYHRIVETFKFAYAKREGLADGVGKDVSFFIGQNVNTRFFPRLLKVKKVAVSESFVLSCFGAILSETNCT